MRKLILGSPGCGKTSALIEIVERELANGTHHNKIAFLTFSRAATHEVAQRVEQKFGIDAKKLWYFKTIHALALRALPVSAKQLMRYEDYCEVCASVGVAFSREADDPDTLETGAVGNQLKMIEEQARIRMVSLEEANVLLGNAVDPWQLRSYAKALNAYKEAKHVIDFTDLLERFVDHGDVPDVDVLIVDEAQDLSKLQWAAIERIARVAKRVYFAGDDKQAIHAWCGADVAAFLSLDVDSMDVLETSWRLPREVWAFSTAISDRIGARYDTQWSPHSEGGAVTYTGGIEGLPLSDGTWLILTRNHQYLSDVRNVLEAAGVFYGTTTHHNVLQKYVEAIVAWETLRKGGEVWYSQATQVAKYLAHRIMINRSGGKITKADFNGAPLHLPWFDALTGIPARKIEYIRRCKANGERLTRNPRVRIGTIHSAKGKEADNVVLLPAMSAKSRLTLHDDPDAEHRVWFVGASRAKQNLYLVHGDGYPFPEILEGA